MRHTAITIATNAMTIAIVIPVMTFSP